MKTAKILVVFLVLGLVLFSSGITGLVQAVGQIDSAVPGSETVILQIEKTEKTKNTEAVVNKKGKQHFPKGYGDYKNVVASSDDSTTTGTTSGTGGTTTGTTTGTTGTTTDTSIWYIAPTP